MGVRLVGLCLGWSAAFALAACGGSGGASHASSAGSAGEAASAGAAGEDAQGGAGPGVSGGGAGSDADAGGEAGRAVSGGAGGAEDVGSAGAAGVGGAKAEPLPGSETFTPDGIIEVRLTLSPKVWDSLEEHGNTEHYVAAAGSMSRNDGSAAQSFAQLGVRHKGAWSLHHCWDDFGGVRSHLAECQKLSYKLKFDEYDSDGNYDGLSNLNLHAASGDDTKLRELVAYQTFRDAGVDAPRAAPARLYINDEFQGIFIAVEEVDDRYAAAHFPAAPSGNLYKEVWPNSTFTDEVFTAALETNKKKPNIADVRSFAHAVFVTTLDDFDDDLARHVDIEQLLGYIAVDRLLRNWDGITAFYSPLTPHNFYWYHHPGAGGRFQLIPWDLDNTLAAFDPYMDPAPWFNVPPVPDLNSKPANCYPRPVWDPSGNVAITPPRCDKFLDLLIRKHWSQLVTLGGSLREGALAPASMQALADHYRTQIADIVADDPTLDAATWSLAVDDFSDILLDAAADFDAFLAGGLLEEAPTTDPDGPTQEELDAPTLDDGLHVGGITNFEFTSPPFTPSPVGVVAFGDSLAAFVPTWNTKSPLSGKADTRLDFTFSRGPEPYDEWVNLGIFSAEADVSSYRGVVVWLASDIQRQIRIRVMSPAYDDTFGGVWSEFGIDDSVGPIPRAIAVDFDRLYYPPWARAAWTSGQGFPGSDEEARAVVLSRFNGLMFVPAPTLDASGELLGKSETGYLQVDNIYFR